MASRHVELAETEPASAAEESLRPEAMPRFSRVHSLPRPVHHNPFVYKSPISAWEWFKIFFFCITGIAFVRIFVMAISLIWAYCWGSLAIIGLKGDQLKGTIPFSPWRRALRLPVRFGFRVIIFCLGYHWVSIRRFPNAQQRLQDKSGAPLDRSHSKLELFVEALIHFFVFLGFAAPLIFLILTKIGLFDSCAVGGNALCAALVNARYTSASSTILGAYTSSFDTYTLYVLPPMISLTAMLSICLASCIADQRNAPKTCLIVANHVAHVDVFPFVFRYGISCAMKKELLDVPFFGPILQSLECLAIERFTPEGRKRSAKALELRASSKCFPPMIIFPEGTTTNGELLVNFRPGAFSSGRPVHVFALDFRRNKHVNVTYTAQGWNGLSQALRMCCQFCTYMDIDDLGVYNPSSEEQSDATLYANNVRSMIARHLEIGVTEHTAEDVRLFWETGMDINVELREFRKKLGSTSYETVIELIRKFAELEKQMEDEASGHDTPSPVHRVKSFAALAISGLRRKFLSRNKEGAGAEQDGNKTESEQPAIGISIEKFCKVLGVPAQDQWAQTMFRLFDKDGNGLINFREWMICMVLYSESSPYEDKVLFTFHVLDKNCDGYITRSDLMEVMTEGLQADETKDESTRNRLLKNVLADWDKVIGTSDKDLRVDYDSFKKVAVKQEIVVQCALRRLFK
eukprot:GILI01018036.1.p1 GENE.GILI01018036.1~~GILI01018036.1.p1  ORF type:complete len:688 (-),score=151.56 GILI01018036.1:147-2210(-)